MGLFNGLNNGLSYDGINNGLQSSYYSGLVNGLMPNETTENGNAFITVWDTRNISAGSSNNRQIRLPLTINGVYNFVVDWGDGSKDIIRAYNAAAVTHTYASVGIYTVKIKGVIIDMFFTTNTDVLKIINIKKWGTFKPFSPGCFSSCLNLTLNDVTDIIDLSSISVSTSLTSMFSNTTKITQIQGLEQWDVSKVTSMNAMFSSSSNFNQSLNNWNTSNITTLSSMFNGAVSFDGYIGDWDVSNVISMNSMFQTAYVFNQPIGNWDTSKVTNMNSMFNSQIGEALFNQPLSGWNTSACTNMQGMFYYHESFNQNLDTWDTGNVINFLQMFQNTVVFNNGLIPGLPGTLPWNTSACTNMQGMFTNAIAFNQNINSWNVSNVTNMSSMFSSTPNFNQPLSSWDVRKVTNMTNMFNNAISFDQNIGDWKPILCTNFSNFMFGKTPSTFSTANLDAIYSGWTKSGLQLEQTISFGSAKYTTGTTVYRDLLTTTAGYGRTISVTNVINNGSGLIRIITNNFTSSPPTNSFVQISGVLGVTNANGNWGVTLISSTPVTFDLNDSTFSGTYAGGGIIGFLSSGFAGNTSNNGSGLIRISVFCMIPSTGTIAAQISGVSGTFEANGTWLLSYVSPGVVDLIGSTFINPWNPSGGQIRVGLGWTITDGGT